MSESRIKQIKGLHGEKDDTEKKSVSSVQSVKICGSDNVEKMSESRIKQIKGLHGEKSKRKHRD